MCRWRACAERVADTRQAVKRVRVGSLALGTPEASQQLCAAFEDGLREHGSVIGSALTLELRWANGALDRLPALAADLVRRPMDITRRSSLGWPK